MKKIATFILFVTVFFTVSVSQASAQTNMCNQRCEFDADCGSGYSCYVGVCRLQACPASSSCACGSLVSPTPVSSPKATASATATPKATIVAKPTGIPKATLSATLKNSPKTGAPSWVLAGMSGLLFVMGTSLAGAHALFAQGGKTPQEISSKRQNSRTA